MKRIIYIFSILFVINGAILAQVAADYYLPLYPGNYLLFQTNNIPQSSGWEGRITCFYIDGADSIAGHLYYREKGIEILDNSPKDTNIFRMQWLRKDSVGEILVGAINMTNGSSDIDSAEILETPGILFPNWFLTKGFAMEYLWDTVHVQDTVLSTTETVDSFTDCIEIKETHTNSLGNVIFLEYHYYAKGIGMVMNIREIPVNDVHTDKIIEFNNVTTVGKRTVASLPKAFLLNQNYPNPFNPSTLISYRLPKDGMVTLKVYNILGNEVATLVNGYKKAGSYSLNFNAAGLTSGVYFYCIRAGNFTDTKKLVLLK